MVNNIQELADQVGTNVEGLEKAIYKGTDCGAWIRQEENSVVMGSIVEGSDAETETFTLTFPFEMDTFWKTLQIIEDEADMLWHEANDELED